jgi:hypothetical protein
MTEQEFKQMLAISTEEQIKEYTLSNEYKCDWQDSYIDELVSEITWHSTKLINADDVIDVMREFANIAIIAGIGISIMRKIEEEEQNDGRNN